MERRQNSLPVRNSSRNLLDAYTLLTETQRIARIGSWWRSLAGPIHWSVEMYRIFGVSPETFVPTVGALLELIHPADRQSFDAWYTACAQGGATGELVIRRIRPDSSRRWISVRGSLTKRSGDTSGYISGTAQDITETKDIEEQNKLYATKLEISLMQTVDVITAIFEIRDPYTAGHERRVAEIAVAIGAELGFDAARQQGLRMAGYLHDVGKIIIPAELLSKPGKISAGEIALIREHAQAGYDVLNKVAFPWPVANVALQHHEKIDGSGYPQGLKGDEIILEARIVAVADVVEAMSSHRPYRPAVGLEKALAEIERGRGAGYDADAADACLRLFRDKGYQLPR